MMNRNEAIQTLSKVGKISVSYAEDLYDSFFEKPVVPQFVADWYEKYKENIDYELWEYLVDWVNQEPSDFKEWLNTEYGAFQTLVNMHQFGYEVEERKRYTVRVKGIDGYTTHLNQNLDNQVWFFASNERIDGFRVRHTRKELEANGFGWVFDCPGVEVKEVTDE
jgi:hypothetical protein